jgi:putative hydrolase of HD superfamily
MDSEFDRLIQFMTLIGKLKSVKRSGWIRHHIEDPESVADHSFRVSLLVLAVCRLYVGERDILRCLEIALVHDIAESIIGDIAPIQGIKLEDKFRLEKEAIIHLSDCLQQKWPLERWIEYEKAATPEGIFVHDMDKIEAILQALEYDEVKPNTTMVEEFFNSARTEIRSRVGSEIFEHLAMERT